MRTARALQSGLQRATGGNVSDQTRRPRVGLLLTAQHRGAGLGFAREHWNWQAGQVRPELM